MCKVTDTDAISRTFVVLNELGLHARPASFLVRELRQYTVDVTIHCGATKANGKSVFELLTLAAERGMELTVHIRGAEAAAAMAAVERLFESKFGEQ